MITDLTFQYYSDDRYMITDGWLFSGNSDYRSSINKEKDIEQQIPDIIKSKRAEVEKISQPDVNYYNYEKINGKYYQWVTVPLIKIDDTKDYYEQETLGYYMKIRYLPMVEKIVSSEYLYDNIKTYAISLGVVLVISIICSYIIVKPIKKIEKVAKEIANNNFDSTLDIYYRDELGSLSNSINSMSYNLKETIEKLKEEIAQVKRLEVVRKEFIATFTHEIKTPLAIINGYSELIEGTKEHLEIQKYLAIIDEQTVKINKLVQAMLNLSKLESNLVTLKIEKVDLEDIVTKVIDSYEIILKEKKATIDLVSSTPYIKGDREQLETVISNFLSNALHYVDTKGKIYITIDQHSFSIENEGPMIPDEKLSSIWENFQTGNTKGTGLGLSICKHVLELHHYIYGVENTSKGVKFYFQY